MKDIVITGAGLICSLGTTVQEIYGSLLSGKTGIGPITGFDATGFLCRAGAQVSGLDPSGWGIHPRDMKIMEASSLMLIYCAREAFHSSHLNTVPIPEEDIGIFVGMGPVDYDLDDVLPAVLKSRDCTGDLKYDRFFSNGYREIHPLRPLSMLNNISMCQTAIHLNIRGENAVFSPLADAGCQALGEGARTILEGKARAVLTGGVSEIISPMSLARGHYFNYLNTEELLGKTACRPFSKGRKGTILGEGCAIVTLESRASATRRGIPFHAMVSGYGTACEMTDKNNGPTVGAIEKAMTHAMADARVQPVDIDLIIAHGDGSPHGDGQEIAAIQNVFLKCIEKTHVFSSKGASGNLLAGAAALDTVLAVEMIKNGIVPHTLNAHPLPDDLGFHVVSGAPLHKNIKRVLINSRNEEGSCASLIIGSCH